MIKFKLLIFFFGLLCITSMIFAQGDSGSSALAGEQSLGMSKAIWDQGNGRVLCGYCPPETEMDPYGVGFSSKKDIKVTAAIRLSEGMTNQLKGKKIYSLKVGVIQDVVNVNVFIMKTDHTILWEKTTDLKQGWNDVVLENPLEVPAVDELYLGYTFVQLYVENPRVSPYVAGASLISKTNGLFLAKNDEPLTEYNDKGALCLLAELEGSGDDYKYVGSLRNIYSSYPYSFKELNKPARVNLSFLNEGGNSVSKITLGRTLNEKELSDTVCIFKNLIKTGGTGRLTLNVAPMESGEYSFILKKIENTSVPVPAPKTIRISVSENKQAIQRMVLVEEFTSQNCGNCPAGQVALHEVLKGHDDRVAMVLHHSGYDDDAFTTAESKTYCYFYNGGTFAPAVMMNRTYFPELDAKMVISPVLETSSFSEDLLSRELDMSALISVGIKSSYNETTRELTLTVSGYKTADLIGNHIGLNVYVLESEFIAWQYDPNGGTNTFEHNNFLRKALSDVKGDVISFKQDGTYSRNYTYVIPEGYLTPKGAKTTAHPDNMHIVAFVSNYDTVNPDNCVVLNANKTSSLNDETMGLKLVSEADQIPSVYIKDHTVYIDGEYKSFKLYNLQGMVMRNEGLSAGIYVIKIMNANHKEFVQKVLVQ